MILMRHITVVDAKKILVWRNHKQTRENSVNKNLINQTDHVEWLKKSLIDKSKFLCLAFDSKEEIGVVNFTEICVKAKTASVSIYINPELFGQGYGTKVLQEGIIYFKEHFPWVDKIKAVVLKSNAVSLRLFEKCSFQQVSVDSDLIYLEVRL
jgi:UDP-4-amino-4,6-dideoxy-N-acetyl-beta-L-altrosamine N-acetyltransferase